MNRLTPISKYIIFLFIFILFNACSKEQTQQVKKELPPLKVNTITVQNKAVPIWKRYTGRTKASSSQQVKARVAGVLKKRYFRDGQIVKKGQKLFMIEQDEYISALEIAKAKMAQDEAALKLAKADVQRYAPLVKEGLAPRATLEQYQAKEASLRAAIAGDKAQIRKAKLNLSYTIVRAPISGHVSTRYVDIGNLVGQGESTLLTTIVKTDPIYAYFSPSQDDFRIFQTYKNKDKPDAYIELEGGMQKIRLDGYIDFQNNIVDPLTSTITMRATIKNPDYKILPGTFVYVNIFINDKYKFRMIPPDIIFNDQQGKFVYVVDNNSSIKRVDITTGYTTKYLTSIKSGLKDGDRVIISALMKLKDGMKVIATDVTKEQGVDAILKKNNLIPSTKR